MGVKSDPLKTGRTTEALVGMTTLVCLYLVSRQNYLLFHVLVELFTIAIGLTLFVIAWNLRRTITNQYVLFIGIAYLFVAALDTFHTVSYKGMGVFSVDDANPATQLWIAARFLQGFALLAAPYFLKRKLNSEAAFFLFSAVTALVLGSIFLWGGFPVCYVEGVGLTPFKIGSEYVISILILTALILLYESRSHFDGVVLRWIGASIIATIASELAFIYYVGVSDVFNVVGHFFRVIAFYLIYKAIVETAFLKPYQLLFRNLVSQQEALEKERKRAQGYLDVAGIIVVLNTDQTVALVNKQGCLMLGCEERVATGKNWFDTFVPERVRGELKTLFAKLIAGNIEGVEFHESPIQIDDGQERMIRWHNSPLKDESGRIIGMLSAGEDITERLRADAEKEHLESFPKLNPNPVVEIDRTGKVRFFNPAAERLFPDLRGLGTDHPWFKGWEAWGGVLSAEGVKEERREINIGGQWFHQTICFGSDFNRILIYGLEITSLKQAEARLLRAHEELDRRVRERTLQLDTANRQLVREIEERKKIQEELSGSLRHFRNLIDASLDPLVTINADGKITEASKATELVTGVPREQLVGSDFSNYFTDPQKAREGYQTAFTQGFVRDYPLAIRDASGRTTEVLYNATVFRDETGKVQGVFAAARDVTELRTAQRALQQSHADLERRVEERTAELAAANQELESFSYSVSHDLQAPLRAIDGYGRMILRKHADRFDGEIKEQFDTIRRNAQMMGRLIEELLAFSRLGRKEITPSKLDMGSLLEDTWQELRIINPHRNMTLEARDMPPAFGDRTLIKQVMLNLLSNAVKFTKYKDCARIEAGGTIDGDYLVFCIKDNGIGFDMAYHDKMFGVFQRLHEDDAFEGTGVGLAIVQRIIHRHGGRVWAEGTPDRGASFFFYLKRKE